MPGELNRHGYPIDRTGYDAWSIYTKREREKKMTMLEAKERPPLRDAEIVTNGHEVPLDTLKRNSTVGKIAHLANDHGWIVKLGMSEYRTADRYLKEEVVEGRIEKHYWVNAFSPDMQHYLSVSKEVFILDGWPVGDIDEVKIHISELGNQD